MPAGTTAVDPTEFLASERLLHTMEALRTSYDMILLDSPPIIPVSDALVMSPMADRLLVIARMETLDHEVLTELKRVLDTSPTKPLGFVATNTDDRSDYGYGTYSGTPDER
jgi:succinoglycan biosynthesis transport protein ExoP